VNKILALSGTALWLLLCPVAHAAGLPADGSFLPLAEVREGMEGYGLTVFHGSEVDTFAVKVIGIQRHNRVAGSMILVELSGHDLDFSAVPMGMSGSPVFLDGKLAGAVSFGWAGALRPLVGLTPAEEILSLPSTPAEVTDTAPSGTAGPVSLEAWLDPEGRGRLLAARLFDLTGSAGDPPAPVGLQTEVRWPDPADLARGLFGFQTGGEPTGTGWQPLPTGILYRPLGGVSFAPGGLAGAARAGAGVSAPSLLEPGSACAIPLVLGAAQLGAIGTTTWIEADRVYLMGHPFMQRGPVSFPLAAAEILAVFPSRNFSFKVGSIGPVLGSVHHDLRAGLAGSLGPAPEMVPVSVTVERTGGGASYRFEVVKDPQLSAGLVFWSLYNALLVSGDDLSLQTIRYDIETLWRRGADRAAERVRLNGAVTGPGSAMALGPEWMAPLQILHANRHEVMDLQEIAATLTVSRPMESGRIAAFYAPAQAHPGQVIDLAVTLQPRRGQPRTVAGQLAVPDHLPPGRYRLLAANARDLFALEAERAAGRFADPSLPATLAVIRSPRSATELVLALFVPSRGVVVDGRELADLPPSVAALLQDDRSGRVTGTRAGIAASLRFESGLVLQGNVIRDITLLGLTEPIGEDSRP